MSNGRLGFNATPISMIMEDSIHISSGSLSGSSGELIIPLKTLNLSHSHSVLDRSLSDGFSGSSLKGKKLNSSKHSNDGVSKKSSSNLAVQKKGLNVLGSNSMLKESSNDLSTNNSFKTSSNNLIELSKKPRSLSRSGSKEKFSLNKSFNGKNLKDRSISRCDSFGILRSTSREKLSGSTRKSKVKINREFASSLKNKYPSNELGESEDDSCSSLSESTVQTLESRKSTESHTLSSLYNDLFLKDGSQNDGLQKINVMRASKASRKKRKKGQLLLKLTPSEMDLLSQRTGEFNGVNDKYRKFLSGDATIKKVINRQPWELLVGLPPSTKRGKKDLDNLYPKVDLNKKRQALEELRILTHSLKTFNNRLNKLQEENTLLIKLHERSFNEMNRKVSKITTEIEKMEQQLLDLRKQRRVQKKELIGEWNAFVKKTDWQVSKVQSAVKEKENQFEETCKDLIDLQQFKDLTLQGTQAVEDKKQQDQIRKQEILLQHEKEMELLTCRIKEEDLEISNQLCNQVGSILDNAQLVISNLVDKKTLAIYRKNHNLKHELSVHTQTQERNLANLEKLTEINSELKAKLSRSSQKPQKLICNPDIEFSF